MQRGILAVQTSPKPGEEEQFNAWYDTHHVPEILASEGFLLGRRFRAVRAPGDAASNGNWLKYVAVYDIESNDLAASYASLTERFRSGTMTPPDHVSVDPPHRSQLFEEILRMP
jgi:hypothetical protein